jgi:hypothetical protein
MVGFTKNGDHFVALLDRCFAPPGSVDNDCHRRDRRKVTFDDIAIRAIDASGIRDGVEHILLDRIFCVRIVKQMGFLSPSFDGSIRIANNISKWKRNVCVGIAGSTGQCNTA